MVCLGNICRSPLAEGILQHKANRAGLHWIVDSAGTSGHQPGCSPHKLSQKIALHNGIDIRTQKCRQFTKEDITAYDKIFVMDGDNLAEVKRISGNAWEEGKVDMILNILHPGSNEEVPDPWYGTENDYEKVYAMLDKACDKMVEELRN